MRPLILSIFILLLSAICSCRTARQSVSESADSTKVEIKEVKSVLSTDEILYLLNSSRELDLSGITVEFFPPVIDGVAWLGQDSAHPDSRAAPKSLTIDNAKAKERSDAATHQVATVGEEDTVNVNLAQSSAKSESTRSDTAILRPSDWVIISSLLALILLLSIILFIRIRSPT